jgi:hypothetical protein
MRPKTGNLHLAMISGPACLSLGKYGNEKAFLETRRLFLETSRKREPDFGLEIREQFLASRFQAISDLLLTSLPSFFPCGLFPLFLTVFPSQE